MLVSTSVRPARTAGLPRDVTEPCGARRLGCGAVQPRTGQGRRPPSCSAPTSAAPTCASSLTAPPWCARGRPLPPPRALLPCGCLWRPLVFPTACSSLRCQLGSPTDAALARTRPCARDCARRRLRPRTPLLCGPRSTRWPGRPPAPCWPCCTRLTLPWRPWGWRSVRAALRSRAQCTHFGCKLLAVCTRDGGCDCVYPAGRGCMHGWLGVAVCVGVGSL